MLLKSTLRQIRSSLGRYLAILAIIALGVGMFSGLRVAKSSMLKTADEYIEELNLYDFRLVSTLGLTQEDVEAFSGLDGVEHAVGSVSIDVLYRTQSDTDEALHIHSLHDQINGLDLQAGRLPQAADECVVDALAFSEDMIGQQIVFSDINDADTLDSFTYEAYTVVGTVNAVTYTHFDRGATSLADGHVSGFVYILPEGFCTDYYTEIYLDVAAEGEIYSEEYDANIDAIEPAVSALLEECAQRRYGEIYDEVAEEILDAQAELDDGWETYRVERADAEAEIADAKQTLADARAELDDGWLTYDAERADAEAEITEARQTLADARVELDDGWAALEEGRDELARQEEAVTEQLRSAQDELNVAAEQLEQSEQQLVQMQQLLASGTGLMQGLNAALGTTFSAPTEMVALLVAGSNPMLNAAAEQALAQSGMTVSSFTAVWQQMEAALGAPLSEPVLSAVQTELSAARAEYEAGTAQLVASRAEAEQQLSAAAQQLDNAEQALVDGEAEYESGLRELETAQTEAHVQFADAERELNEAEAEYTDGLADLAEAEAEAEAEFADAEQELNDAQTEIDDAWEELAELKSATTYALTRSTNIGYASLEGDSSIVEGISRVFPLFFFLVAALVCVTTMTRMVDDQRTQNGVFKALGFGNGAIISQYFIYAGSASFIGCLIGFLLGSWALPKVLWAVYQIMYTIARPNALVLNWGLFAVLTALYLVCALGATWFVCRRDLAEAPAELIRPKAPQAGKRILIERVKFIWKHVPFLHKVSIRNILRYKKRMIMMILGIGGCTALLLTGFGISDSIKNIVDYQYDEIEIYDASVTFVDELDEQTCEAFEQICDDRVTEIEYLHINASDLIYGGDTESVNVVVFTEPLESFVVLGDKNGAIAWPGVNEVVINCRVAETMGLNVGDTVSIRDSDLRSMTLTVSGIFDNYVYDYAFVDVASCVEQWGSAPEFKSAYFITADGVDTYTVAADILGMEEVAAVSVNEDFRVRINSMLSSLDYIVLVIIICAGALAFIVLYNLTNISITERNREIATLKVLGFYPNESAAYVFRENLVLTGVSALLGLPLGVLLLRFVISEVKISLVYFSARLEPLSYVYALLLTFGFAGIVCFFLYFKLEKINMAESLKSIE